MSKKNDHKRRAPQLDKKTRRQIELNAKDPNAWLGGMTIEEFAEFDEPEYDENGEIIGLVDLDSPEYQRIIAEAAAPYAHIKDDDERTKAICDDAERLSNLQTP